MSKPLCIDLFCGLGGWTEGFLAEGYRVVGFDIEQHVYGEERYPAQLVLQDVRTIHGKQFKDAAIIVASSPCPEYSYMSLPWKRAKQIAEALRGRGEFPEGYRGSRTIAELNDLFEQPKRIQREAIAAAGGRFIPLIQENVKGAQPWVGRAQYNYGSFYLWGDVPALMPSATRGGQKFNPDGTSGAKNTGGSWFNVGSPGQKVTNNNPTHRHISAGWRDKHYGETAKAATNGEGFKQPGISGLRANGKGDRWFQDGAAKSGSKSPARKAASARIAKIPFPLASHIARVYYPKSAERVA